MAFDASSSMVDAIFEKFESFSDRTAVLDFASGEKYTFQQLKQLTENVARGLSSRGFGKGDVLSLFGHNCLENAPIVFGAIVAGGAAHLVKPLASEQELCFHFNFVRPKIIVTTFDTSCKVLQAFRSTDSLQSQIFVIGGVEEGCQRAEDLLEDAGDANPWGRIEIDPLEDVALMMQTGGTTGMSKTVMITHEAVKMAVRELSTLEPKAHDDDVCLGYIPFNHVFSFILFYGAWLRLGCTVLNVNSYNPAVHLKAIEKHKITRMGITPTALVSLITNSSFDETDLSSILTVRCGGAAMSHDSEKHLLGSFSKVAPNADFSQAYGMTELCGAVTGFLPMSHPQYEYNPKLGSVGVPKSDVELRIISCDEHHRLCGPGEKGEIIIRSRRLMKGYFKNEEATNKVVRDGWYHTGDFGYLDEEDYLYVIDRIEDLIRHKDGIIVPTRVEGILRTHPGIKDCVVVGRSSECDAGEEAMAFVVRREGSAVTEKEVCAFAGDLLEPREQLTGGVRFVKSLPKSPAGKLLRSALRDSLEMVMERYG